MTQLSMRERNATDHLEAFLQDINSEEKAAIVRVQSAVLLSLTNLAHREKLLQLTPVLLSPITDPLNHRVYPATVKYEERMLQITASMVFHKQVALMNPEIAGIFILSPNVRLELASVKSSGNHLLEFSQFDFELRDRSMHDAMETLEKVVVSAREEVEDRCAKSLARLKRKIPKWTTPFPRFDSEELQNELGDDYYERASKEATSPFFITNFEREFYDRRDTASGRYRNFDLVYPEAFGEAASGAEREFDCDRIVQRMRETGVGGEAFNYYVEIARRGLIPRTAGAGLGIERFAKYLCGCTKISHVNLFDRSINSDFVF